MAPSRRAFTLIEMLLVVAIIVLLISMLLPAMKIEGPVCKNQMRTITTGWQSYAFDNVMLVVDPFPGSDGWIGDGNSLAANDVGKLPPYVGYVPRSYRCPQEISNHFRTYSMNDHLGGGWGTSSPRRHLPKQRPAETFVLLEENDPRGWNKGSWVTYQTPGLWVDYVSAFHERRTGMNISFADTHVETWIWQDPRTAYINSFYASTPNNVDCDRLQKAFMTNY